MVKFGPYTFEEYAEKVRQFHGAAAPGIIIGGFMVNLSRRAIPDDALFDVIVETVHCLPDAVQILTPCTVGNQWLKVMDVGRFAMTFYNKETGEGVRVHLDVAKLDKWPLIHDWFLKLKPKKAIDKGELVGQIKEAGESILTSTRVTVSPGFLGKKRSNIAVCPKCSEPYRAEDGDVCPACQGDRLPY
jgi:formylmethanofuran dehydrogenase subunit E